MKKVKGFIEFINEGGSEFTDKEFVNETMAYIMDIPINEKSKFMDDIKNSMSKNLLGSMSYIKMIDQLVEKLEEIEKETIEKSYDYEEDIDTIEIKLDVARRRGDVALTKSLSRQKIRIENESKKFLSNQQMKIKNGVDLIEKAVGGKERRKEYAKLKLTDKDHEIAEFTYEYAKKKSTDSKDLKKLKDKYDKARKEIEKLINSFKPSINKGATNPPNVGKSIIKKTK